MKGCLKLIDFGIAKVIPNGTVNIRRDYQTGTVNYMAPETIKFSEQSDKKCIKVGRASDVWSLGCILFQLIFKNPPFGAFGMIEKLSKICDVKYKINYPLESLYETNKERVKLGVECMRMCLYRDSSKRCTISTLLEHEFLRKPHVETTKGDISWNRLSEMVNELSRVPELAVQDLDEITNVISFEFIEIYLTIN